MKTSIKKVGITMTAIVGIAISCWYTSCKKADQNFQGNNSGTMINKDAAARGTTQRPISDYLSAQGSTSIYVPPVPDHIGWSAPLGTRPNYFSILRFASVDYNGTSAAYLAAHGGPTLNTKVSGTIKETEQADGRAKVTVTLHTENALIFAFTFDPANYFPPNPFSDAPLDFGYRANDLLADNSLKPALGSSDFSFTFFNSSIGDPIPDLTELFSTRITDLVDLSFHANGSGVFHAQSGFPDLSVGAIKIDEIGLLKQGFTKGIWVPVGTTNDAFPHEVIRYSR